MYKLILPLLMISGTAHAYDTAGIQDMNVYSCTAKTDSGEINKTAILADSVREAIKFYSLKLSKVIVVSADVARSTEKVMIVQSEEALNRSPNNGLVAQAINCSLVVPATK